jgi:leucyl-tRNA synthetase
MHKRFQHQDFESKWQAKWALDGIYDVGERDESKEKEYILVEWPYPSGNLHVGHWYAFGVPDIYARYQRMSGKQVLYPMGFDAFGLPAENAAIKRAINPKDWTDSNITYMKQQLKSMGNAFSWDKTTSSTDEEYYKWTQWMFTEFFRNDVAFRGVATVNWDPVDNTVIANEQVLADGTSERSGAVVIKKELPQWMLRITNFANELIDDLDELDWPEYIKEGQRQWIGRSKGALIQFALSTGETVKVFTTRADTLFGVTYLVLAPEHALVKSLTEHITNQAEVFEYITTATQKAEQDRLDATKEKTGVILAGITAINPCNGEAIPVFVADYVIGSYGTGAVMAVPAHDARDYAFAQKFSLPIVQVISGTDELPYTGSGQLTNSGSLNGLTSEVALPQLLKKVNGEETETFRLRDWSIGRQRYWGVPIPIVYDPEGRAHPVPLEHLPWTLPTDVDFTPTGIAPLAKSEELKARTEKIFGPGWTPEVETMDTFVDSSWYFLRYIDANNMSEFSSLQKQRAWMQVDTYFGGAEHTTMHLLYSRFWHKALFSLGLVAHKEPYKRRFNRSQILGTDGNKMSKSKGNIIDPDEQVALVGADTVKMYLAFMGPYAETNTYPWDMGGIAGIRRFLERVNGLQDHLIEADTSESTQLLHKTILKLQIDIPQFKFNTAISALMIYVNHAEKAGLTKASFTTLLRLLAPFAPHLTEELWQTVNPNTSIHTQSFPVADETYLRTEQVTIGVQINGKLRGQITLSPEADELTARSKLDESPELAARLAEISIKKVIYVPGRILNIIATEV